MRVTLALDEPWSAGVACADEEDRDQKFFAKISIIRVAALPSQN